MHFLHDNAEKENAVTEEHNPQMGHNQPPVDEKWLSKAASQLKSIGKRLADQKALAGAARKTRDDWTAFGSILSDARQAIPSNKLFNQWLKENDLEQYADRNSRTDAMWMAGLSDDMLEVVPADLHSPKAVRAWYRKTVKEAVAIGEGDIDKALAQGDYAAFINAMDADDWDLHKAKWEADQDKLPFAQLPAADAAAKVLDKIVAHDRPGELWDALVALVNAGGLRPADEGADEGDGDAGDE